MFVYNIIMKKSASSSKVEWESSKLWMWVQFLPSAMALWFKGYNVPLSREKSWFDSM